MTNYPDIGPVHLGEGFDAGTTGDYIGALDDVIVRAKVDALLALVIDRHEGDIDRAGFRRVGRKARIGQNHELHGNAKLLREFICEIDRDAMRPAIGTLDGEESRQCRRENDADPEAAGGNEFFDSGSFVAGRSEAGIGSAGDRRSKQLMAHRAPINLTGRSLLGASRPARAQMCTSTRSSAATSRRNPQDAKPLWLSSKSVAILPAPIVSLPQRHT